MKTYHYSNKLYSEWRKNTECFALIFNFSRFPIFSWFDDKQTPPPPINSSMYLTIFGNPRPWSNTVTDRGPSCWIFLVLIKSSFYTCTSKHYSVSFYHWWFENNINIMKTKKIQDWKWDSDYGIWPY